MSIEKRVAQRVLVASAADEIEKAMLKPYNIGLKVSKASVTEATMKKHIREAKQALGDVETSGAAHFPALSTALWNLAWSLGVLKQKGE